MSICVMVKVPEGLVIAADSAATVEGSAVTPGGVQGPVGVLKVHFTATKVMQIRDLPVGVLTWGAASLGERTIASMVEEFENKDLVKKLERDSLDVKQLADEFWAFMNVRSDDIHSKVPKEARPRSGILLCGYSKTAFFPEEYAMMVPTESPAQPRPPTGGTQNFGANWYGQVDAINRLHHGRDDRLFPMMVESGIPPAQVEALKAKAAEQMQYPVIFQAMPLLDAVAYAEFVVRVTIDRFKFVVGPELCGGPIDVATITRRDGFQWFRSKTRPVKRRHSDGATHADK